MRDWLELIGDALREIRGHKLRSLLTLSGIVFGAASVVSMTSLAAAMKTLVYDDLTSMGLSRSFFVNDQGPRSDAKGAAALRHTGMRITDLEALRALPGVASKAATGGTSRSSTRPPTAGVYASTASMPAISSSATGASSQGAASGRSTLRIARAWR